MPKQTITIIIIALGAFALGFFISDYSPLAANQNQEDTFEAGWQAAEQRLEETGYFPSLSEEEEINSVSGEIKEIRGNKITLNIFPLEPLANPELDTRVIEVGEETKIYQMEEKNQEQYQREMADFEEAMQTAVDNPENLIDIVPPDSFTEKEISLDSLQIGQQISAQAEEEIRDIQQFKVIKIVVQFEPEIEQ